MTHLWYALVIRLKCTTKHAINFIYIGKVFEVSDSGYPKTNIVSIFTFFFFCWVHRFTYTIIYYNCSFVVCVMFSFFLFFFWRKNIKGSMRAEKERKKRKMRKMKSRYIPPLDLGGDCSVILLFWTAWSKSQVVTLFFFNFFFDPIIVKHISHALNDYCTLFYKSSPESIGINNVLRGNHFEISISDLSPKNKKSNRFSNIRFRETALEKEGHRDTSIAWN